MTVAISVALCALILYRPRHFINHLLTYLLTYLKTGIAHILTLLRKFIILQFISFAKIIIKQNQL